MPSTSSPGASKKTTILWPTPRRGTTPGDWSRGPPSRASANTDGAGKNPAKHKINHKINHSSLSLPRPRNAGAWRCGPSLRSRNLSVARPRRRGSTPSLTTTTSGSGTRTGGIPWRRPKWRLQWGKSTSSTRGITTMFPFGWATNDSYLWEEGIEPCCVSGMLCSATVGGERIDRGQRPCCQVRA